MKIETLLPVREDVRKKLDRAWQKLHTPPSKPSDDPIFFDCITASHAFKEEGLTRIEGHFEVDKPRPKVGPREWHWWNTLPDGSIVDATLSQFNDRLHQPVEEGILIIGKESSIYNRYYPKKIHS